MATRYWVLPGGIGSTYNFTDTRNWSLTSGGAGGASVPTQDDDIFIDVNSVDMSFPVNNEIRINTLTCKCRNLHVQTGFGYKIEYNDNCALSIYGTLDLIGAAGQIVQVIGHNTSGDPTYTGLARSELTLIGTLGTMTYVSGTYIRSSEGKRIYVDSNSTITNCPFWRSTNNTGVTIHITNATDLQNINNTKDANYVLDASLDLAGALFTQLGSDDDPFTGNFDGQNHTISNFHVNWQYTDYPGHFTLIQNGAAFFGQVGNQYHAASTIKRLTIHSAQFYGEWNAGSLIGILYNGLVNNCHATNCNLYTTVSGDTFRHGGFLQVGGLIGLITGQHGFITKCSTTDVSAQESADTVTTGDSQYVGGCVGYATAVLVTSEAITNIIFDCQVDNFTFTGNVRRKHTSIGGFIGQAEQIEIYKCYAVASVTVQRTSNSCGGFVGVMDYLAHIHDCYCEFTYAISNFDADGWCDEVAGFCGDLYNTYSDGTTKLIDCYAMGSITITNGGAHIINTIGGFVGYQQLYNHDTDTLIRNCFCDVTLSISATSPADNGGFIGVIDGTTVIAVENCAWVTDKFAFAIGHIYLTAGGQTNKNLAELGLGTDETDHTLLYSKTHPVYAQVS